jgi:hypothetical protein
MPPRATPPRDCARDSQACAACAAPHPPFGHLLPVNGEKGRRCGSLSSPRSRGEDAGRQVRGSANGDEQKLLHGRRPRRRPPPAGRPAPRGGPAAAGGGAARERKHRPQAASPTGRRASWRALAEGQPPQAAVRPVSENIGRRPQARQGVAPRGAPSRRASRHRRRCGPRAINQTLPTRAIPSPPRSPCRNPAGRDSVP